MTVSPQVAAAAVSNRTPDDVLNARAERAAKHFTIADVVKAGAPIPAAMIHAVRCPHCDKRPALDPAFHGQFCVYCDNDDCPSGEQQAMALTLEAAVSLWNERAG